MNPEKKFLLAGIAVFVLFAAFASADPYYDFYGITGLPVLGESTVLSGNTTNLTGSIYGYTSPSGAQIYIDYVYKGLTPYTIYNVPVGGHNVIFEKAGYQSFSQYVTVTSGQTTYVIANLTPTGSPSPSPSPSVQPQNGTLYAYSNPAGAMLYVARLNGGAIYYHYYGNTPVSGRSLVPGNYRAQFVLGGFNTFFSDFVINSGQTTYVGANLTASNGTASPSPTPTVNATAITIFNVACPDITSNSIRTIWNTNVNSDSTAIYGSNNYYVADLVTAHSVLMTGLPSGSRINFYVKSCASGVCKTAGPYGCTTRSGTASPSPAPNQTGSIRGSTNPEGAQMYVDNVYRGVTPLTVSGLIAGTHNVLFIKSGYYTISRYPLVRAGQTTYLNENLVPIASASPSPSPSVSPSPQPSNCTETDGGYNVWLKGTTYGASNGIPYSYTDSCLNVNQLSEFYCAGSQAYNTTFNCNANGSATCFDGRCITSNVTDVTPPAAITNLAATTSTSNSITLQWTAPGDDGSTGTATIYDMRYSTSTITVSSFAAAIQASGEPLPAVAGSTQTMTVMGLLPSTVYYFAIKAADEVPNWSSISNVVSRATSANGTASPSPSPSPSVSPSPQPSNCSETDGGHNVWLKGTTYGSKNGIPYSYTDSCLNVNQLSEFYCAGSQAYNTTFNCNANGSATCLDGRCVPNPTPNPGMYEMTTYVHDDLDYQPDSVRYTTESSRFGSTTSSFGPNLGPKLVTKDMTTILNPASGLPVDGRITYPLGTVVTYENQRLYLFSYVAYDETVKRVQAKYSKTGYEALFDQPIPICLIASSNAENCPSSNLLKNNNVEITFLGDKYRIYDHSVTAGAVSSITLGKHIGSDGAMAIGDQITTPNGYVVRLTDIGAFAPVRAQFDVLDSFDQLLRRIYLGAGESAMVSEANNIVVKVNSINVGNSPAQSSAAVFVFENMLVIANDQQISGSDSHLYWKGRIVSSAIGASEAIYKIQLYNDIDQVYKTPITQTLEVGESISIIRGTDNYRLNFLGLQDVEYDTLQFAVHKNQYLQLENGYVQGDFINVISSLPNAFLFGSRTVNEAYIAMQANGTTNSSNGSGMGSVTPGAVYYINLNGQYERSSANLIYYYPVLSANPATMGVIIPDLPGSPIGIYLTEKTEDSQTGIAYVSNSWHLNLLYDRNLRQLVNVPGATTVDKIGYGFGTAIGYPTKETGYITYRGTIFAGISSTQATLFYPKQIAKARFSLTYALASSSARGSGGGSVVATPVPTVSTSNINPAARRQPIQSGPKDPLSPLYDLIRSIFG